ncbi:MAG: hypothetical protein DRN04_10425 [Thermoprotei archaeon]|nr:MAG: hypothetical protein DRN04_10425 [Thermoprotei archaeon]
MFNNISLHFKSKRDTLPLSIILSVSPLPPLSTFFHLKKLGFYSYLPIRPSSSKELKKKGFSKDFIELYEEALRSQTTGSRRGLKSFIEEKLAEFKTSAEIAEMKTLSNASLMNSLAIVVPTLLTTLMLVTSPEIAPLILILLSIVSLLVILALNLPVVISIYSYKFRKPEVLLSLLAAIPLYLVLKDIVISLIVASVPASIFSGINVLKETKLRAQLLNIVKTASQVSSKNVFKVIKETPQKLFEKFDYGVMKAVVATLYLISAYAPCTEAYDKLTEYTRIYVTTVKRIRSKFNAILLYSAIMIAISVSTLYLTVFSIGEFSQRIPRGILVIGYSFIRLPTLTQLNEIKVTLDFAITVNVLAFSLMCAMLREGNPLYFALYFPLLLIIALICKYITLTYLLPSLIR